MLACASRLNFARWEQTNMEPLPTAERIAAKARKINFFTNSDVLNVIRSDQVKLMFRHR